MDVGLRACKCYDELLSIMLLQIITHQEFIMSDLLMVHMAAGGVRSKSKKNECKCLHAYRGWSYYGYLFNIIPEDHCGHSHTQRGGVWRRPAGYCVVFLHVIWIWHGFLLIHSTKCQWYLKELAHREASKLSQLRGHLCEYKSVDPTCAYTGSFWCMNLCIRACSDGHFSMKRGKLHIFSRLFGSLFTNCKV